MFAARRAISSSSSPFFATLHRSATRVVGPAFSTAVSGKTASKGIEIISPEIGLNEDQTEFYSLARSFADKELRPHAAKWDNESIFPVDTYRQFAELGFAGMFISEEYGGSGLKRADAVPIVEGLATGCVGTTAMLTIHNMCAVCVEKWGNDAQKAEWLPKLCSMELLVSFCLTEPGSGSDAASLSTKAVYDKENDEYTVNGGKVFISGAGLSDLYLVMCRTGNTGRASDISCLVIPKDSPGLSFGASEKKMGWNCQPTRQVNFDNVKVPASNRLGTEGDGFKVAMSGLDGGRLNIASCSLGAAQACFEIAISYVKERKQFGSTIADFQTTQFKLADMAGKILSSRHMIRGAAGLLDEGHPAATAQCALAKKVATDSCFEVCNDALQMLGGYGYLKDYEIERYVRDCRVHQILEGTNEVMRLIVGRSIVSD